MGNKKWRQKNPFKYAYNTLKNNSKRRGVPFNLSLDQFKEFAIRVDYLYWKGIYKTAYHIDRIDPIKGYILSNLQLMTNEANVKKRHGVVSQYYCPYEQEMKYNISFPKSIESDYSDVPF